MSVVYEIVRRWTHRSIFRPENQIHLDTGDQVVVEGDGEEDIGEVVWKGEGDLESALAIEPESYRKAATEDVELYQSRRQKEIDALEVFGRKIAEHDLPMNPEEVHFEGDKGHITFYFTAKNRVDFRDLVRTLARIYQCRIKLRQINLRQAAQRLGDCGTCGRVLCCASFLHKLSPVPAEAARDQGLARNRSKLIGVCGQLKCCLRYELGGTGGASQGECGGCCGAGGAAGEVDPNQQDRTIDQLPELS